MFPSDDTYPSAHPLYVLYSSPSTFRCGDPTCWLWLGTACPLVTSQGLLTNLRVRNGVIVEKTTWTATWSFEVMFRREFHRPIQRGNFSTAAAIGSALAELLLSGVPSYNTQRLSSLQVFDVEFDRDSRHMPRRWSNGSHNGLAEARDIPRAMARY